MVQGKVEGIGYVTQAGFTFTHFQIFTFSDYHNDSRRIYKKTGNSDRYLYCIGVGRNYLADESSRGTVS